MAPVLPQLSSVTSEALQAKIRSLLPSQNGFGADLAASNVIQLTLDLTAAAEGATIPVDLQRAASFGNITAWTANNGTAVIANSPGFYRIYGISNQQAKSSAVVNTLQMSDGVSTKDLWVHKAKGSSPEGLDSILFDIEVFLSTGESVSAITDSTNHPMHGSVWQIADVNGVAINPSGFSPQ